MQHLKWNQFNNDGPRTTNNAEGFHNRLNRDAQTRLTLFKFVHFLKELQLDLDVTKIDLISESPSRQTNKYQKINETIEIAKQNYKTGNVPILRYLDSVSIVIKLD